MAYNPEKVGICRCPECFAKEIDLTLRYDEKDDEYYCVKCCFTGKAAEIEDQFTFIRERKYRAMRG